MVPTLQTIMNSSYYYEYEENIHLSVRLTPAKHFGSLTDIQHSFTYAVFILLFNILSQVHIFLLDLLLVHNTIQYK